MLPPSFNEGACRDIFCLRVVLLLQGNYISVDHQFTAKVNSNFGREGGWFHLST